MPERIDTLIAHAHLFTMQGDGVGHVAEHRSAEHGYLHRADLGGLEDVAPVVGAYRRIGVEVENSLFIHAGRFSFFDTNLRC